MHRFNRNAVALTVAVAVFAGACSAGTDESNATSGSAAENAATSTAPADVTGSETEETTTSIVENEPADDAAFPVEIEHVFGTTLISEEPQRVVSLGTAEGDLVLATGVQPVGVRANYDDQPVTIWPWADQLVTGEEPELLAQSTINFEAVAALEPDLIFAMHTDIESDGYETLSAIAPTIARPPDTERYQVPWRQRQTIVGEALGRTEEAAQAITDVEARFDEIRAANPEFADAEAVLANAREDGGINTFSTSDPRYDFLVDLGFDLPTALVERPDDQLDVSPEQLDVLDGDVIIWSPTPPQRLQDIPTREPLLTAAQERRELILDPIVSIALVEASPLSLQYVIDRILADLALAVDGDPDTVAASAVELYDMAGDGPTPDEQAAMAAWQVVLDPSATLDDRRPHIEDFDALIPTIEAAVAAGDTAGGVQIIPRRATINDTMATVVFDAVVGDTTAPDLTADLMLVDGVWVASRDQVCTYVALIGVPCPA